MCSTVILRCKWKFIKTDSNDKFKRRKWKRHLWLSIEPVLLSFCIDQFQRVKKSRREIMKMSKGIELPSQWGAVTLILMFICPLETCNCFVFRSNNALILVCPIPNAFRQRDKLIGDQWCSPFITINVESNAPGDPSGRSVLYNVILDITPTDWKCHWGYLPLGPLSC